MLYTLAFQSLHAFTRRVTCSKSYIPFTRACKRRLPRKISHVSTCRTDIRHFKSNSGRLSTCPRLLSLLLSSIAGNQMGCMLMGWIREKLSMAARTAYIQPSTLPSRMVYDSDEFKHVTIKDNFADAAGKPSTNPSSGLQLLILPP